jgi:hypothetical protein
MQIVCQEKVKSKFCLRQIFHATTIEIGEKITFQAFIFLGAQIRKNEIFKPSFFGC